MAELRGHSQRVGPKLRANRHAVLTSVLAAILALSLIFLGMLWFLHNFHDQIASDHQLAYVAGETISEQQLAADPIQGLVSKQGYLIPDSTGVITVSFFHRPSILSLHFGLKEEDRPVKATFYRLYDTANLTGQPIYIAVTDPATIKQLATETMDDTLNQLQQVNGIWHYDLTNGRQILLLNYLSSIPLPVEQ